MAAQDVCKVVDGLQPALQAAAKNLLFHLFGAQGMPWGTSFDELERLALQAGQQLTLQILRAALQHRARAERPDDLHACPSCAGPLADRPPESCDLHTQAGDVAWEQPQAYCPRCRRAFSPSGPQPGTGPAPLQPAAAPETGVRRQ